MVLALAALAAAAASFPTGFGFGAGYGAGVRIGYDVIYPKIAGQAAKITDDILASMNKLFGGDTNIPIQSGGTSGFEFSSKSRQSVLDKPVKTIIPTGRSREIADSCSVSHKRWTALQRRILDLNRTVNNLSGRRLSQTRTQMSRSASLASAKSNLRKVSVELNAALSNPNNQSCASTWDPKAVF